MCHACMQDFCMHKHASCTRTNAKHKHMHTPWKHKRMHLRRFQLTHARTIDRIHYGFMWTSREEEKQSSCICAWHGHVCQCHFHRGKRDTTSNCTYKPMNAGWFGSDSPSFLHACSGALPQVIAPRGAIYKEPCRWTTSRMRDASI